MPNIVEDIPTTLQPAADAALAWINEERGAEFKLTGLVDPDPNWNPDSGDATELGLVLCENDMCSREQVRLQKHGDAFQVAAIEAEDNVIPPHLDPPAGVRASWLDEQMAKHGFIVVVFYRGFW